MCRVRKSAKNLRIITISVIMVSFSLLSPVTGYSNSGQRVEAEQALWLMKPHAYCSSAVEMSAVPVAGKGEVE